MVMIHSAWKLWIACTEWKLVRQNQERLYSGEQYIQLIEAFVAEWSKASDSSSDIFGCVSSNLTECMSFRHFRDSILFAQCRHFKFRQYLWTKQIELVPDDQVKNSFFLVFRKLIYSPNICGRLVVQLSKVKELSTTDSFLFVSKYNVRLSFPSFKTSVQWSPQTSTWSILTWFESVMTFALDVSLSEFRSSKFGSDPSVWKYTPFGNWFTWVKVKNHSKKNCGRCRDRTCDQWLIRPTLYRPSIFCFSYIEYFPVLLRLWKNPRWKNKLKIGLDSGDRLTRVQVIKKGPNRFVAWVTVVSDNIYPFVDFFNSSKKMSGCRAALKHSTDCAKKVVLHGVKGRSEDDIKAMLGASKVRNVLKKHNTAFVVLESETYAEAVLRNNVPIPAEVEAQRFNQRPRDPIKAVSKRLTKMYKELLAVVTDLSRQVSELKQAMTTGVQGFHYEWAPQHYIRRLRAGKPALKEKKNKSDAAVRKHLLYSKKNRGACFLVKSFSASKSNKLDKYVIAYPSLSYILDEILRLMNWKTPQGWDTL